MANTSFKVIGNLVAKFAQNIFTSSYCNIKRCNFKLVNKVICRPNVGSHALFASVVKFTSLLS